MKGRLLDFTLGDPFSNVAFEEAMFRESLVPTLRIWRNQRSVVIGRAQMAKYETDLGYCERLGIPVVRRMTAGGAVYNGPGNLNWTFIIPAHDGEGFRSGFDAKVVFERFATLVVGALGACGVRCRFLPPNSIVDERGKVCGMAAYVSKGATLCHGTLLVHADLHEVQSLTRPSKVELPNRYPRSRSVEVSNCGVDESKFIGELAESMGGFREGTTSAAEEELCSKLTAKYRSQDWNLGDPFGLDDF